MTSLEPHNFRVLIAGGGVAALEAALCLRELAGDRIDITMLCPQPEFVYRPMRVREPFAYAGARHYPLAEIARDLDIELRQDAFKWLDADQRMVHTLAGRSHRVRRAAAGDGREDVAGVQSCDHARRQPS